MENRVISSFSTCNYYVDSAIPPLVRPWFRMELGSCALSDPDELPYLAYTNALIQGRPRRNVGCTPLSLNEKSITGIVFAADRFLTHSIPSITNKPVLWARYTYTFSDGDWMEQKKRYYQYLYYSGVDERYFTELLQNDFTTRWEIFGAERANPLLSASHKNITDEDIQRATTEYASFIRLFDTTLAKEPLLSYAIVSPDDNLERLDRWYERDSGESLGQFVIYRLKVKATE